MSEDKSSEMENDARDGEAGPAPADGPREQPVEAPPAVEAADVAPDADDVPADENQPEPATAETAETAEAPRRSVLATVLALLALITALAVIAVAWTWQQQRGEQLAALQAQSDAMNTALRELAANSQGLSARQDAVQQILDRQNRDARAALDGLRDIERRLRESEDAVGRLGRRFASGSHRWQLAEIEHLLLLANDRVLLARDVAGARAALQIADRRIGALADPQLFPVREQITAELAALAAVPQADLSALVLTLASLAEGTRRYTLKGEAGARFTPRRPDRTAAPADGSERPALARFQAAAKEMFLALFTLQRDDTPQEPLMPPDQKFFLYQNLELQFDAARLAVLRRDQGSYAAALRSAEVWLQRWFDTDKPAVRAALDSIAQIRDVELQPQLPAVDGSLRILRGQLAAGDS